MKKSIIVAIVLLFTITCLVALPQVEKRVYEKVSNEENGSEYHQCLRPGTNCTV